MASFLYLVSYRAHGRPSWLCLLSGLSMHKAVASTSQSCIPDLYRCFPTCSLMQAQSYVTVSVSCPCCWLFFVKSKILALSRRAVLRVPLPSELFKSVISFCL